MTREPLDAVLARSTIDTLRFLAADAVERARSGHPGTPMEAAPLAYLLYRRHLRHNPADPAWPGRDRLVLSCGHASMLLYGVLHLAGYALSLDDLKNFRQLHSPAAGHPEFGHAPGVETTTGPLGQGLGVSVGMAMGGRFLAEQVSAELFNYRVYALCSDGDLMEGLSSEAASLAGHLHLGNLIVVYLDNRITIEGETSLAFSEQVATRFLAYDWQVLQVEGENLTEIEMALNAAKADPRPSLIIARTHIAPGAPTKQDSAEAHGAPLGAEELAATKSAYGWDPHQSFLVSEEVRAHMGACRTRGRHLQQQWQELLRDLEKNPSAGLLNWLRSRDGALPEGWDLHLPAFGAADGPLATRQASGIVLNALAARLPLLLGGSADLAPSTNTSLKGERSFSRTGSGRNLHFGVREHAMGAVLNGLSHTPGLIAYGATFLIFSDYMRPPMRLAAMMGLAPIYVFTHDSIALGEDGPTHQPVEQLPGLRALPNLHVIRPADANETAEAWRLAVERRNGPTALVLSRQGLPVLDPDRYAPADGVRRGGYVLAEEEGDLQALLLATGAEVHVALAARELLQAEGVATRVVSLPCWEKFAEQAESYRRQVLPPSCRARVAIEAASPLGWERWVGTEGEVIGMRGFGASAPGAVLLEHFGFTPEAVGKRVKELLARSKDVNPDAQS
ncbi:transketolase [Geoalkalibacter ferrihydriticus]|uniref:Transketolase n=2 Tax=Geoalkalibacter ferrihydriticus TaxID=392333 RepID=A0A0C2HKV8_9BACT|nr:transketolase [Geoalkalibacter ferrihydriticus]KIH77671.1 transketolase [Geoalkalibacter ferrihydriticus DSM 17813]SDL73039.1 transketolase [Geoalkalibacter ferrihydriticus]